MEEETSKELELDQFIFSRIHFNGLTVRLSYQFVILVHFSGWAALEILYLSNETTNIRKTTLAIRGLFEFHNCFGLFLNFILLLHFVEKRPPQMDPRYERIQARRRQLTDRAQRHRLSRLFSLDTFVQRVRELEDKIANDEQELQMICQILKSRSTLTLSGNREVVFFNENLRPYYGNIIFV
ncbi:uncharacterized protein LOC121765748 [Salvia splendens]|uniref:uncharacterized protein LOC121765748 n=1 Tax=Salvia splendens TaxID=180675 RepID=UPI001C25460A|nr:uncharacterized protein LOC121765748 [Salvia splendens]